MELEIAGHLFRKLNNLEGKIELKQTIYFNSFFGGHR